MRPFENLSKLNINCRKPRQKRPTAVTHGGKVTANGPLQGVGPTVPYRRAPQ
jgi:hypothetical protein